MPTECFVDEWVAHSDAYIKGVAVDIGVLAQLWVEYDLTGPPSAIAPVITIEASMLEKASRARAQAKLFIPSDVETTGAAIKHMLLQKSAVLMKIDPNWKTDAHFYYSQVGESGEKRLMSAVELCFPSKKIPDRTVQDCLGRLANIEKSKLFELVGLGTQSTFKTIKGFVTSIQERRLPNVVDAGESPTIARVADALTYWCTFADMGPDKAKLVVQGPDAPTRYFDKMSARVATGDKAQQLGLKDLDLLHVFLWRLSAVQQKEIKKWREDVLARDSKAMAADACSPMLKKMLTTKFGSKTILTRYCRR